MSFFQTIRRDYGSDVVEAFSNYKKQKCHLAKVLAERRFYLRCREYNINLYKISNFNLSFSRILQVNKKQLNRLSYSYFRKLFNLTINNMCRKIVDMEKLLASTEKYIVSETDSAIHQEFLSTQSALFTRISDFENNKRKKSFDQLLSKKNKHKTLSHNDKWFVNLTENESIPEQVKDLVSLGQKFCPYYKTDLNTVINITKNIESSLCIKNKNKAFTPKLLDEIRSNIIYTIKRKTNHNIVNSFVDKKISNQIKVTKSFLNNNPNIFFTLSDKTNATVCMYKDDYIKKALELLQDESTYRLIDKKKNILRCLQKSSSKLLKKWRNKKYISDFDINLTQTDTVLPKFYGLLKTHKFNNPLRPIVSLIGSPSYRIAKILSNVLTKGLPLPKSNVKNSFEMKSCLKNIKIPSGHSLISIDALSLFSNITLEEEKSLFADGKKVLNRNQQCRLTT